MHNHQRLRDENGAVRIEERSANDGCCPPKPLETCCCCVPLRQGVGTLAVLDIIIAILIGVAFPMLLESVERNRERGIDEMCHGEGTPPDWCHDEIEREEKLEKEMPHLLRILIVSGIFAFIAGGSGLYAACFERPLAAQIYLIMQLLKLILKGIAVLLALLSGSLGNLMIALLVALVVAYFALVSWSYYMKLKMRTYTFVSDEGISMNSLGGGA